MNLNHIHKSIKIVIALVWLVNGLFCKVLNLVPRHQQIVESVLGDAQGRMLTLAIGLAEIGMFFWIISGIRPKINARIQIFIILSMNVIECIMVPQLLLFQGFNFLFAFLFCILIYLNTFVFRKTALRNA